ncbi:Ribosome maturation factor [Chlorella sorokiniana]|uniref:Ribosome maturation factor n=1 Tax=Chlorella sorokiniana TaxID=3076 RepID=A0A2P6U013_CHLSO|nr:Ribosome maturation factor [Chlorella sorokiniana]|eukprot:PRW59657.1 Ribosome maturation factor [Chlorella sorokiniana]
MHAAAGAAAAVAAAAAARRLQRCDRPLCRTAAAATDGPEAASVPEEEDWVEIGKVGPPHGVRGEFKVQPLTDFPEERLGTPGPRWLQAPAPKIGRRAAAPPEEVELEWGRMMISKGNEVWLVKLEGVESPEEAALLRGHSLLIPASARQALEDEDEFYVQDLVGLTVVLQSSGELVGHVSDVFDGTGTHDVLRIQLAPAQLERLAASSSSGGSSEEGGEEGSEEGEEGGSEASAPGPRHVLLPFAKAMVPVVDLAARRMEITPPEGLLELAAPSNLRRTRRENRGRRERRKPRPRGQSQAAEAGAAVAGGGGGGSEAAS